MRDDDDAPAKVYALEDLVHTTPPGEKVEATPFGCLIMPDGTVHALTEQFSHGITLAVLYPELAQAAGYEPPDEYSRPMDYQEFELENKHRFPVVRISIGGFLSRVNISKWDQPATPEQIRAVAAYASAIGHGLNEEVHVDSGSCTLRKALKLLALSDTDMMHELYSKARS